ncbi:MAG: tRNA guanosine(34) transglycosylase Tgt [Candidatus Omnitrophica bacterium]|nr:tRNA guanosine(34) transglycosylase Tgt [Candidatus Omnitrophota bacterium]
MFELLKTDKKTKARLGIVRTAHGDIESPFFMPVGTNGTVKSLTFDNLRELGAQLMLSNTYHLNIRPGLNIIQKAGGLHKFTGWDKPILTDSGGYQVFSLAKLRKISDDGVQFRSHIDGDAHYFDPEKVMEIQKIFGSDIVMPLDECAPYPCDRKQAEGSVRRTTNWAKRSRDYFMKHQMNKNQSLFGIIQGSTYKDLREQSAKEILDIGFDGYAIGGVSVGEPVKDMFEALEWVEPFLPKNKLRYFMGIGYPDQIVKAVGEGIDMFDTVLPTRFGRHATAFTRRGRMVMRNAIYADDFRPLDPDRNIPYCTQYSRSYLRHLANQNEMTALHILSYCNLHFYVNLMKEIREAIKEDRYDEFQREFLKEYNSELLNEI